MTKAKNTLYLLEMGMNDNNITTDIKNHRVRVVENIDIVYNDEKYNMFFEFTQCTHYNYRTTNKRTGAPLKKPIRELIIKDGLHMDTEFEKMDGTSAAGTPFMMTYRKGDLEQEIRNEHHAYTKQDILEIVNRYKVGEKFTNVCLIEATATEIIKSVGGYRERDVLNENKDFQTYGDSYFSIIHWDDMRKVVRCNKREWQPTKDGKKLVITATCDIDLVTGAIVG